MTGIVMRHEITKSYVDFKAIYVSVEYLADFPDVGVQFVIIANSVPYTVTLDNYHRIKLTDWFNSQDIVQGDVIELNKVGHAKYSLNLERKSRASTNKTKTLYKRKNVVSDVKNKSTRTNRQVELEAIKYVKKWLNKKGTRVRDAEGEGCDLITDEGHYIEVKGSSYARSPIMIYESIFKHLDNEGISKDKYFIYIVSNILSDPILRIITPEMQDWQQTNIRVLTNNSFKRATPISLSQFNE